MNAARNSAELRRRRLVVVVTLIVGAVLLGRSLSLDPGDSDFYLMTLAVALTWVAGGLLSGPISFGRSVWTGRFERLGRLEPFGEPGRRRPVVLPIVTGLLVGGVFILGALVVEQIPPLRELTGDVLAHAEYGSLLLITVVTLVNGVAEEVFFRGALFAALGPAWPVTVSTVVYALATAATGNPMLVFAALILGTVLGIQRRLTGGVLAPMLTHVSWSTVVLFALPPIIG